MKKRTFSLLVAVACLGTVLNSADADHIWINEFHYDNTGADEGEFIEVGLRTPNASGFNVGDYAIELYNGNDSSIYENSPYNLSTFDASNPFDIAGSASTITLYSLAIPGIQNGSPDGIALVNVTNNSVTQFLSYEGTIEAVDGTAAGMTSTALALEEPGPLGTSLSAVGFGVGADQFGPTSYQLVLATQGGVNVGQTFAASAVPEPGSVLFLSAAGLIGMMIRRRNEN